MACRAAGMNARTGAASAMTLEELADLMINLGATEAMNLDGGSSTTMWIDGRVVNKPVAGVMSAGQQRPGRPAADA